LSDSSGLIKILWTITYLSAELPPKFGPVSYGFAKITGILEISMTRDSRKDWKKTASGAAPDIPAEDVEKIVPVMEALDRAFEPLRTSIPPGTDMWVPE